MESSVQSMSHTSDSAFRFPNGYTADRLIAIRHEMEYLNTIGKQFVAAIDRFQVHRALLKALKELYSFAACCILLKGSPFESENPFELFIIPCYPLDATFLESIIQRIASAASVLNLIHTTADQLARTAYFDAPDELALARPQGEVVGSEVGSFLNIPLIVENRIIGMLSLFDEKVGTFDADLMQMTTMIADYAAIALENVRLHERESALWRQAELERMRLSLIIGSMAEGLLITDDKGAITSVNTSAEQLLAQAQVSFKPDIHLHKLAKASKVQWISRLADIVDMALAGYTVKNQELVAGQAEERVPLTLSISAAPLLDGSGASARPVGVVAVLNDITPAKQVERLKDEFVSVVSHELRTPLTAIKGYTQHLVRRIERRLRKTRSAQGGDQTAVNDLPENHDLRSLNIVQSQTEHLERLVSDLLDLSQVQWGKLQVRPEPFNLVDLLVDMVRSVQSSTEQHTISLQIEASNTNVVADRARIAQVVGNILDNAVKYSPYGGQVIVRLKQQDGYHQVSISDQGLGVSPELFDHIFERFYRVHNTATQPLSGIGLGLYVAKAIIDQHGGRIWLERNEGMGSTFHFTLPRNPSQSS
jgi:two-component system phosphate regulon sensor histidine kinase PhoR